MGRTVEVVCSMCGRSEWIKTSSTDASRSGAEALMLAITSRGWSHGIGFAAILTGRYYPVCPTCEGRRDDDSADHDRVPVGNREH